MRPTAEEVQTALTHMSQDWSYTATEKLSVFKSAQVLAAEVRALQAELKAKDYCQDDSHTWLSRSCRNCAKPIPTLQGWINGLNEVDKRAEAAEAEVSRLKARLELAERVCLEAQEIGYTAKYWHQGLCAALNAWSEAKK